MSFDGQLAVWDVTRGRSFSAAPDYALQASQDRSEVLCVQYHQQRGLIFTAGTDALVTMWNIYTRAKEGVFRGHKAGQQNKQQSRHNKRDEGQKCGRLELTCLLFVWCAAL